MFADDTKVVGNSFLSDLQQDIDNAYKWAGDWHWITFNQEKIHVLPLGTNNPGRRYNTFGNSLSSPITSTDCKRDLGGLHR
jgi:hypothetical protein